ncbi:MAG: YceI family protein [Bacteroidetes bacterium]|nr:YceI family protein [Bacteroidota bacterium]
MINTIKTSALLLVVALAFSFNPAVKSKRLTADKTKSYIKYYMYHSAHDWDGTCNNISCNITYNDSTKVINGVGVAANISCFNTANDSRDSHTLEVTEALKYPSVQFLSTSIVNQDTNLTVNGNLTFHNVKKPISFKASKIISNGEMTVRGTFSIKITDYGMELPTLMMVATEDLIKIEFVTVFKVK